MIPPSAAIVNSVEKRTGQIACSVVDELLAKEARAMTTGSIGTNEEIRENVPFRPK